MIIKEYLSQAFLLDKLITARQTQISELRDMRDSVGYTIRDVKVQSSPLVRDKMADLTVRMLDMIAEYEADISKLLDIKVEVRRLISNIENPTHRLIMEERYINLKRWEDIAEDNNYSWQWLHKIHKKALGKLAITSDPIGAL